MNIVLGISIFYVLGLFFTSMGCWMFHIIDDFGESYGLFIIFTWPITIPIVILLLTYYTFSLLYKWLVSNSIKFYGYCKDLFKEVTWR